MFEFPLTILTATYNRQSCIKKLYDSLSRQTVKNFQWLIIDDGSIDETEENCTSFNSVEFLIEYHKKKNGGKHTALNYAHPYIKGELVFMVDSDDLLTENAVELVLQNWEVYKNNSQIGGLSFRCFSNGGKILSTKVVEPYIDDDISFRVNHNIVGDRAEVLRTDLFKKWPFPVFEEEKFMGEGWLFRHIANEYQFVYLNSPIYIREYIEGGLSANGRLLRMECPLGMMENCRSFFSKKVRCKVKLKQLLAFGTYGICAELGFFEILRRSENAFSMFFVYPFSLMLFFYWKKKFGFKAKR